ncbi:MAG: hypothetical protein R6X22_11480 [Gemmatimonadota bacterium]
MRYREIGHLLGALLVAVAIAMLPSAAIGTHEGLLDAWLAAAGPIGLAGLALWLATPGRPELTVRDALVAVGLGWIVIVAAGAVPFLTTGTAPSAAGPQCCLRRSGQIQPVGQNQVHLLSHLKRNQTINGTAFGTSQPLASTANPRVARVVVLK